MYIMMVYKKYNNILISLFFRMKSHFHNSTSIKFEKLKIRKLKL